MLSSYDLSESLSEMELFQNSKKFKVGVNVLLAVQKMSKAALFRSNSNVNSEANTPLGSPIPVNKEKLSPRLNPGGGESEGKEVTSPVSPKASSAGSLFVLYIVLQWNILYLHNAAGFVVSAW